MTFNQLENPRGNHLCGLRPLKHIARKLHESKIIFLSDLKAENSKKKTKKNHLIFTIMGRGPVLNWQAVQGVLHPSPDEGGEMAPTFPLMDGLGNIHIQVGFHTRQEL